MRIGIGYDIHRLTEGRALILGGVEIPYIKGLFGYSDADVLLHAISDAMLGAANMGDIGTHFPDRDPSFKGASSITLLKKVNDLIKEKGYSINNIDAVIVAEEPKIRPFIDAIKQKIAEALNTDKTRISVKATTNEGIDSLGRKEAIASHAVVTLKGGSS